MEDKVLSIDDIINDIVGKYKNINLEGTKEALESFDEDKKHFLGFLISRVRQNSVMTDQQLIDWFTSNNPSTNKELPFTHLLKDFDSDTRLVQEALDKNIMEIRKSRL